MRIVATLVLGLATLPVAALDCSAPAPVPAIAHGAVSAAPGLHGGATDASTTLLFDQPAGDLSVAAVLARIHDQRCATTTAADGYQKQTEFDNTPYRFNMRPGQKMSAAEFDAWMESRGIRIVKAKDEKSTDAAATPVVAQ